MEFSSELLEDKWLLTSSSKWKIENFNLLNKLLTIITIINIYYYYLSVYIMIAYKKKY